MVLPACPKAPNKPRPRPFAGVSGGEQISPTISFPIVILRPPHRPKPVISKIVEPVSSWVRPRRGRHLHDALVGGEMVLLSQTPSPFAGHPPLPRRAQDRFFIPEPPLF